MSYESKPGQASAWRGAGGTRPAYNIKCTAHRNISAGEAFEVALWVNDKEGNDKRPDLTGKVQDPFVPQQRGTMSRQEYGKKDDDSSIPF